MRLKSGSVLGTFSKGNDYSLSLNFGVSGGSHCDATCGHHPNSTTPDAPMDCYAARVEARGDRAPLAAKLARHEAMPPSRVCGKAILELQDILRSDKRVNWLRIATNGSVPQWNSAGCTALFKAQFMALLRFCKGNRIKVHFPVETKDKADDYRELLGDLAVVRESIQDPMDFIKANGVVSSCAGAGLKLTERMSLCRDIAGQRLAHSGRKTIVCPAVTASFKRKLESDASKRELRIANQLKAKCGNCDACSQPHIDVIYPAH